MSWKRFHTLIKSRGKLKLNKIVKPGDGTNTCVLDIVTDGVGQ